MKTQEKLDYIASNTYALGNAESMLINRIYRSLRARIEANEEENEVLNDALYSYSMLLEKRLELYDLRHLLSDYVGKKGLKHSLFRIEELLTMIGSDYRQNVEDIEGSRETIEGMKKLLNRV